MKRTHLTSILALALILVSLVLAGCSGDKEKAAAGETAAQSSAQSAAHSDHGALVVGPGVGNLAPDFALEKIGGGQLTLAELKGKAVIIDFWDTWCPPCRRALPHLQALSEAYDGDLVVVGVAMGREGREKVQSFVAENNLTFEFVMADAPQYTVFKNYGGVQSIPTTFLVDREGVIRNVWSGERTQAVYEKAVRAALGV